MMKTAGHRYSLRNTPADRFSGRVLMLLIAIAVAVFGLFAFVGFSMPYEENANFNAPLFTDVLICFIYTLVFMAVAVMGVSVFRSLKSGSGRQGASAGLSGAHISYGIAALVAVTLAVTCLLGSTEPISINGEKYTSAAWLRITDMLINTSLLLIAVAVLLVGFGLSGLGRKIRKGTKRA